MQKKRLQAISEILVQNRRRRSWRRRVGALACAVVVATGSMLAHPALTLEKRTECGQIEHIHTEDCYALEDGAGKTVPVCTPERLGLHQHTEACRNENGDLICGYSDFVVHQHDASCYDEDGTLWCPLPEIEVHIHDENCYSSPKTDSVSAHTHTEACYGQKRGDLICGYAAEGHVHTDECYEEKETLVCPVLEGHKHDESCFDENGVMVCGVEEDNGHIHGAECYETTRELVCAYGETAHQHTDECYTWIMEPVCGFSAESAQPELICGKEEVLLHEHTDTCFDADGNVICGQMQVLEHVHTDDCFQAAEEAADAKTLICEMEEHTHTQECFADQTVDPESSDTQAESEPVGAESGPEDVQGEIVPDSAAEESGSADVAGESAGAPEFTAVRMAADGVAHWVMGAEGTDHSWQTLDAQEIIRIEDGSGNTAKIMPLTAGKVFLVHNYKVGDELHMETFEVDVLEAAEETPVKKPDTDTAGETPAEKPEADTMGEMPAEKPEPETVIKETEETDPNGEPETEAATEETEETDPTADSEKESENGDVIAETEDRIAEEESETETEIETETDSVLEYTQSVAELAGLAGGLSPAGIAGNLASLANRNQSAGSVISVPAASDPSLAHRRMIDAFGDGVDNPDTTVDDNTAEDHSNLYRQYLDVTGAAEPMDVLFVVDCSDDAVAGDGTAVGGTANGGTAGDGTAEGGAAADGTAADGQTARLEAAEAYLKGEDGLAARILAQNAENRIAVCAIDGKAAGEESPAQLPAGITNPAAASNPAAAEPTVLPNVGMAQGLIALPNGVASPDATALPDEGTVQDVEVQPEEGDVQDTVAQPEEGAVQDTVTLPDAGAVQDTAAQPTEGAAQDTAAQPDAGAVQNVAAPEPAASPEAVASANQDASQNSGASLNQEAEDLASAPKPAVSEEPAAAEDSAATQEPAAAEDSAAIQGQAEAEKPAAQTGAAAVAGGTVLVDWTGEGLPEELSLAAAKEEREQASDGSAAIGRAEELFLADEVKENGHRKVVVFLDSDTLADVLDADRVNNVSYFDAAADDRESLTTWLQDLSMPEAVSITGRLSAYTELCDEQTDYKVTMEDADSVVTVLYESGAVTDAGNGILKEVIFDEETRTVSALFCEDYRLQPGYRYTLSFNTTVSGQAYEEYCESGYPSQGDADTDYAENRTSSGQMGFYADDEAFVSYQVGGTSYSETYDKPVMQIAEMASVSALDTSVMYAGADLSDITLPHHKTIDAFRDQEDNPDTTLDDGVTDQSNLYRLYLDVAPPTIQKPMDLLLVLDNSGSMFKQQTESGKYRYESMNEALKQFIPKFLEACEGNRISIVYFSGPAVQYSNSNDVDLDYTEGNYKNDAWTACNWTSDSSKAIGSLLTECKNAPSAKTAGTNYAAGLNQAQEILSTATNSNVSMVFLSDGIPTHYIKTYQSSWPSYKEYLGRGGNGLTVEGQPENWIKVAKANEQACKEPTQKAVDSFKSSHPNLPIYSISFSSSMGSENANYALKAMIQNGGTYNHTESADGLLETLKQTMSVSVSNVSISDTLSAYADLYENQPDYKVTMKRASDEYTVTLYDGEKITDSGEGVLSSVGYDASSKTVSAIFRDDYVLQTGWTYTLSFNVIASQQAHEEFEKDETYGGTKGEEGTDYGTNATSSKQPGFHSNDSAWVKYMAPGMDQPQREEYQHPVIQVIDKKLTVEKKWFLPDGTPSGEDITAQKHGSISFELIQMAYEVKPVEVSPGKNVQVEVYYQGYRQNEFYYLGYKQVKNRTDVTITFTSSTNGEDLRGLIIGSQSIKKEDLKKNGSQYSYTFTISGNTDVYILDQKPRSCDVTWKNHTSGWELVPSGEKPYGTYTIESGTNWKTVIRNLPASGTVNGTDFQYTYRVKELVNGSYDTTYDNNGGVTEGVITIKNTMKPGYELPETGGPGTTTQYTIGGLLTGIAGLLLLYNDKKRRKEGFAPFDAQ